MLRLEQVQTNGSFFVHDLFDCEEFVSFVEVSEDYDLDWSQWDSTLGIVWRD